MKEITVIHGFGAKHYDSAVYIDGKQFSSDVNLDDSEELLKLVKKMAKTFGVKWTEFTAPEIFRLESYYSPIPKTLKGYEKDAIELYKELKDFETIKDFIYYSAPLREDNEKRAVYKTFTLSGGLESEFDSFYQTYQKTYPKVETEIEKQYAYLEYQYSNERYGDKDKQESLYKQMNEVSDQLQEIFKHQLQFVWDSPKKLDPFKMIALENKIKKVKPK